MTDLAKLVVRLEAQSAQLLTELDKANSRIAKFERNASQSLTRLDKKFQSFGFGIKAALGTFLGGISFAAIIDANREASETFADLQNAVERAGAAAGGRSAEDFAKIATELSHVTTVSDEAVQNVQQLLLRFQNIRTDKFDEATKAVLDFAQATKRDLGSAAEVVGKALSDPEKGMQALAKAGVIFSDAQKQVIKDLIETGQRAEAQGLILDGLQKRFGGAAEAARGTFAGSLKAVKNALSDLVESKDGLPGATGALNELASVLQDPGVKAGADALFSTLITGAAKAAELIGKTAAGIAVLFNATGDRVEELEKQIRFLEEQRDSILPGVTNLGGKSDIFPEGGAGVLFGRQSIQKKIDELKDLQAKILGLGEAGIETARNLKGAGDALKGAFELPDIEVIDPSAKLAEAAKKTQEKLEAAGKALTEQVATPYERFQATVKRADELLAAHVITLDTWTRAVGQAADAVDPLLGAIVRMGDELPDLDEATAKAVDDINADIAKSADESIDKQMDEFKGEIDDALDYSDDKFTVFWEQASRNAQDILATSIEDALTDGIDNGIRGVLDAFGKMLEKMAIQAVAADIAGKLFGTDGLGGGGGLIGGWLDKLSGLFGSFFGSGPGAGAISEAGAGAGAGAGDVIGSALGTFFGGLRDQGGRGYPGQAVMIDRGAQPEMFVPDTAGEFYPANQWMMGRGQKVEQNIYLAGPLTPNSARQLEVEAARRQRTASARLT